MSDTQGDRPDESTAAVSTPESTPDTGHDAGTPVAPPAASAPHDPRPAPAAPQAAQGGWQAPEGRPSAPQQPYGAPAAPNGSQPNGSQPYGGQGYDPSRTQPYGAPAGNAPYGAPAYGATRPQADPRAAGHPHPGAAFGTGSYQQTQPTEPLPGSVATASTATENGPRKKNTAGAVVGLIVAAALVGGAAGLGGAYAGVNMWSTSAAAPAAGPQTVTVNDTESVNATTAIAAKVTPSVVTIEAASGSSGGTGSGVILNTDGYVLTNTHVVTLDGAAGDATIRVTTSDGRVYDADVVGTDPTYDLAVIKLKDATDLTPIEFGDSSKLNVGDATVAIGAPLGLSNTVTTGIVSALNRSIQIASSAAPDSGEQQDQGDSGQDSPFFFDIPGQGQQQQQATSSISIAVIQTDAAINPGNSGGALVDSEGKLIGINVAIASAGGSSSGGQSGSIGVGFSIPSDIAQRVANEIIDDGAATHGLLGATVQAAASVQGATTTGAYISDVTSGGAAAGGGLEKGDVVTSFNGVPITDSVDLTAQVRAAAAGSEATLTYVRDGKTLTAKVTLGTLPQ